MSRPFRKGVNISSSKTFRGSQNTIHGDLRTFLYKTCAAVAPEAIRHIKRGDVGVALARPVEKTFSAKEKIWHLSLTPIVPTGGSKADEITFSIRSEDPDAKKKATPTQPPAVAEAPNATETTKPKRKTKKVTG